MKKLYLISFSLLFLLLFDMCFLPNRAGATESRLGAMGGVGFFVRDNTNIFYFPGTLYKYGSFANLELRVQDDMRSYTAGFHLPIDNFILGLYLNRPVPISNPMAENFSVNLDKTTEIFGAYRTGDMEIGISLALGLDGFKDETTDVTHKETARFLGLGFGVSNQMMDVGFFFNFPSISQDIGENNNSWKGVGLGLNARYFRVINEKLRLVPVGRFFIAPTKYQEKVSGDTLNPETKFSMLDVAFGLGLNYQINDNNLLVLGCEVFSLSREKAEQSFGPISASVTNRVITFPGFYVGIESFIKSWLIGRVGAAQTFQNIEDSSKPTSGAETKISSNDSNYKVTLGLGLKLNNFLLDFYVNNDLLFNGPNFISGSQEPVTSKLSISYTF